MWAAIYNFFFAADGALQRDVVIGALFLVLGIALSTVGSGLVSFWRKRREIAENQRIDLSGDNWFAAWETSVNGEIKINTESLTISQSGAHVWMKNTEPSPENPEGGYLWKGQLLFSHGESLMGWYYPLKKENITSRGIMYYTYDSQRHFFVGQWVGKSYDGNLCRGFSCIAKSRDRARSGLLKLIEMAKTHPVNVLGGAPFSI